MLTQHFSKCKMCIFSKTAVFQKKRLWIYILPMNTCKSIHNSKNLGDPHVSTFGKFSAHYLHLLLNALLLGRIFNHTKQFKIIQYYSNVINLDPRTFPELSLVEKTTLRSIFWNMVHLIVPIIPRGCI